jgi:rhodanese-related sulfurtransferase
MTDDANFVLPEVSAKELSGWLETRPEIILLDVREPYEFPRARMPDQRVLHAPLSELARKSDAALPEKLKESQSAPVVVFCHHGIRSAQVAAWLLSLGWKDVYNLAGGIDAYARTVDPSISLY